MGIERRIRDELHQDADQIQPDVDRQLGAVEARARRSGGIGPATALLATAIVVAALILRTGPSTGPGDSGSASPPAIPTASGSALAPGGSAPSFPQIAGTYAVTLDAGNAAVARDRLGGTWTMRLMPDGEVFLSTPPTFSPGANGLSGVAFSLDADRFRTNLFINDACGNVGTYTWVRTGGSLQLTPLTDDCVIRRTLLSTAPWTEQP
jgi:hypothetical protein